MILEITEDEAETVLKFMESGYLNFPFDRYSTTQKEKLTDLCKSVTKKIVDAAKSQPEVLIGPKDLFHMISVAKGEYGHLPADLHLSNKRVDENDFKHISLASAVIMWLNGKNLLKKAVRFDFTDLSSEFEETDE